MVQKITFYFCAKITHSTKLTEQAYSLMKKQEAKQKLIEGCKVIHVNLKRKQFFYLKNNVIYTDQGLLGDGFNSEYWKQEPSNGWDIYGK